VLLGVVAALLSPPPMLSHVPDAAWEVADARAA
jgi:hypothetical protein